MASLNQIARTTRLGMTEGQVAPVNLTPEQSARSTAGMKTALGISEPSPVAAGQLFAVAGARRSLSTEPRTSIYNTLGQRINALESVKKIVSDHYARYDASKRNLAREQETSLAEKGKMEETRLTEQERQQETSLAALARQHSTLAQESEAQQARKSQTAAEQQRQTQAELGKRLAENKRLAEEQLARQKAAQAALQASAKKEQEAQAAAKKKQEDDFQAAQKAAQKAYEEKEKAPKRAYWEDLIRTRQENYMRRIGERDPNALVVYNPGLAQRTPGPDRYSVEIPELPKELYPDDPNYKPPGGLLDLEEYLVDYDKSLSLAIHPAYTRVFWQLKPEQRGGYLDAYLDEQSPDPQTSRQAYLNDLGFELDPDKPLIKEPMPDWKPTPATPRPATPQTPAPPPGMDQPAPAWTPQAPGAFVQPPDAPPPEPLAVEPRGPEPPLGTGGGGTVEPTLNYLQARDRYLQDNPDVARAGMNPWQHYIQFGKSEGRPWPGEEEPRFNMDTAD